MQLAQIGSAGDDVVVRDRKDRRRDRSADAEPAHVSGMICIRPMAPLGDMARTSPKLSALHHGAYPRRRNAEPLRGLGDEGGEWIVRRSDDHDRLARSQARRALCCSRAPPQSQDRGRATRGGGACIRSATCARRTRTWPGRRKGVVRVACARPAIALRSSGTISPPRGSREDRPGRRSWWPAAGRNTGRRGSPRTASSSGRLRRRRMTRQPCQTGSGRPQLIAIERIAHGDRRRR